MLRSVRNEAIFVQIISIDGCHSYFYTESTFFQRSFVKNRNNSQSTVRSIRTIRPYTLKYRRENHFSGSNNFQRQNSCGFNYSEDFRGGQHEIAQFDGVFVSFDFRWLLCGQGVSILPVAFIPLLHSLIAYTRIDARRRNTRFLEWRCPFQLKFFPSIPSRY